MTAATNSSEVFSGTDGALRAGSLHVTGAGTSVDIDNNLNVDGTATVDGQIISQLPQGTAPFVVASTTKVNNLNADLLDGLTTSATDTTGNSVVVRSSGDFSANQITVNSAAGSSAGIIGNASTADAWKTARTLTIDGVVDGSVSINGASDPTPSIVNVLAVFQASAVDAFPIIPAEEPAALLTVI
jgi:cytoskeletal protein CcmA (bactofilin family)